jgi:hypothetical protein
LHPPVRILLQPVAHLDETDRRRDDEFTAPGLLVARRKRTLAQEIEFVFIEAALLRPSRSRSLLCRGA